MSSEANTAPDFTLPAVPRRVDSAPLRRRGKILLVFYTEDSTPVCTRELQPFVADYDSIRELGAEVVAISSDDLDSHRRFAERLGVPFALASDTDLAVSRAFGVADVEQGRARRAVFVIAEDGTIVHANRRYTPSNPSEYEAAVTALM